MEEGGDGDEGEDAEAQVDQDGFEAEAEIAGSDHLSPEQQWLAVSVLTGAAGQKLRGARSIRCSCGPKSAGRVWRKRVNCRFGLDEGLSEAPVWVGEER